MIQNVPPDLYIIRPGERSYVRQVKVVERSATHMNLLATKNPSVSIKMTRIRGSYFDDYDGVPTEVEVQQDSTAPYKAYFYRVGTKMLLIPFD